MAAKSDLLISSAAVENRPGLRRHVAHNVRSPGVFRMCFQMSGGVELNSTGMPHTGHKRHMRSHGVSFQSARTDLLDLNSRGLLELHRVGRTYVFTPVPDLPQRLSLPSPEVGQVAGG